MSGAKMCARTRGDVAHALVRAAFTLSRNSPIGVLILKHLWGRLVACGRLVIDLLPASGNLLGEQALCSVAAGHARPSPQAMRKFPAQETLPQGPSSTRVNASF